MCLMFNVDDVQSRWCQSLMLTRTDVPYTHNIITFYYIITQPMLSIINVVQIFRTYIVSVVQNDVLPIIYMRTCDMTKIFSDFTNFVLTDLSQPDIIIIELKKRDIPRR